MIKRELNIFLIVGMLTVLIDYLTYESLAWTQLLTLDFAKSISFIVGTIFAYFANKFWTFGYKYSVQGSAWRFSLLYTVTLLTNVVVNALVLNALVTVSLKVQFAFLIATAVSATMNFLGMKYFVFKSAAHIKIT